MKNGSSCSYAFILVATFSFFLKSKAFVPSGFCRKRSKLIVFQHKLGESICEYHEVKIPTSHEGIPRQMISVEDLTPKIVELLEDSLMQQGVINVISRHTTTAVCINERESRLARDMERYFLELAPPDERSSSSNAMAGVRYFHNDIDQRPDSAEESQRCRDNGWNIDNEEELQKWRDQEPINAHSHLLSMLVGSSESIPVVDGKMVIGQWQSVLLVDLDGPRDRTGKNIFSFCLFHSKRFTLTN